ncbi:MAG: type II secretion system minor pseudopilin GspK [Nitrospirae bacterium]|nr:type II secretion system minor pseudopilin GspK [Nitrospirota bacterium]
MNIGQKAEGRRLKAEIENRKSKIKKQNGSALIITLLMITVLVALVVEFAYEVYIDTTSLSNWSNAQKASFIAKSGQTISTKFIEEVKRRQYTDIAEFVLPVTENLGPGATLLLKMEDENARFNINSIIYEKNGELNERALSSLKKLFKYLNINPDVALFIADWIDPDDEPRLPFSEDGAKNTFLWSTEELKLIKGVDRDVFDRISPFITVYGNNLININTAKLPVLVSLHEDITEALAVRIMDYRESTPFESTGQIVNVSGMESLGTQLQCSLQWGCFIDIKSSNIRITTTATVNEITRKIESVVDTSRKIYFWREA